MLQKLGAGFVTLAILAGSAPAFAQTSSTTVEANVGLLAGLQQQITALLTQLKSLQTQRQEVVAELKASLKEGAEGDDVKLLQASLAADESIYPEGKITGFFGPATARAVKRFQEKNGLEQVGFVGPKTRMKINEWLGKNPLAFEHSSSTASSTGMGMGWMKKEEKRPCAKVPPGHLIAPGWLRKHMNEDKPVVPPCQKLPPGIDGKLHGTTTPPTTPGDTTAPIVSSLMSAPIATSATITWTTNENASSKIFYATSTPVVAASAWTNVNTSLLMSHSHVLSGLTAATTYYYLVEAKDAAGNTSTSSQQSFMTP